MPLRENLFFAHTVSKNTRNKMLLNETREKNRGKRGRGEGEKENNEEKSGVFKAEWRSEIE